MNASRMIRKPARKVTRPLGSKLAKVMVKRRVRARAGRATEAARRHPLPTAAAPVAVAAAATYAVVHRARKGRDE
ncbi:hypothetical protein [Streptomyces sp. B6B3]|uniref:hypothetical protein n=1 Tax=Streptomyces sp. B6B3 TaxID=3153570 RepID=UPI00325F52CC